MVRGGAVVACKQGSRYCGSGRVCGGVSDVDAEGTYKVPSNFDEWYLNTHVNVPTMKCKALCDLGSMCEVGMNSIAFDLKMAIMLSIWSMKSINLFASKLGGSITGTMCSHLG